MIDLNLDAGEIPELLENGTEEALYRWVTSVNIACGGHAGDEESMKKAVSLAQKHGLRIGAHPSYPDRENFGRQEMKLPREELLASLVEQIIALEKVCSRSGVSMTHVKPHGALYNIAAKNTEVADCLIEAVKKVNKELILVGLAGSSMIAQVKKAGLHVWQEAFADRRYEANGALRSRSHKDALIENPSVAAAQVLLISQDKKVQAVNGELISVHADTICIHGDTPNALIVAKAVRSLFKD